MNAKQRRRFVRQYKEKIKLDQVVCRLEGTTRWFDSGALSTTHKQTPASELNFYYALYIKAKEQTTC